MAQKGGRSWRTAGVVFAAFALAQGALALWRLLRRRSANGSESYVVLQNEQGMEVHISPIGAAITRMLVPDKKGSKADVVLGYGTQEEYLKAEPVTYFGVVVGRVANRIAKGQFKLGNESYQLLTNNGPNALHGGALGLHKRVWSITKVSAPDYTGAVLTYESPAFEEGYPGHVTFFVAYRLMRESNELSCTFKAITDTPTPINMAQHSYFNLAGHNSGSTILDHVVTINGDHYTPVDDTQIPTGEITPVKGTPFDFTSEHAIGERIGKVPGGYDHNYVLFNMGPQARLLTKKGQASDKPALAAVVKDPKSGRRMEVWTTAPGIQFYTGNFLDKTVNGKGGIKYFKHAGLCLETQGFPNAVNQPNFPSVVVQPEDEYLHEVVYKFSSA